MGEINDIGGISLSLFQGIVMITLPLLLALVHWIAPSVRALSHSSLKLQLHFGVDGSAGFYRIEKSGSLLRLKAE